MARKPSTDGAPDPFAAWRGLTQYAFDDAAHLCAGIVPGRKFRPWTQRDKTEQQERAALTGWIKCLERAAECLGVKVTHHPEKREVIGYNQFTGAPSIRLVPAWTEREPIQHTRLVDWLRSNGELPAFFASDRTSEMPLAAQERETLLVLVGVLAELAGFDLRGQTKGHAEANKLLPEIARRRSAAARTGSAGRGKAEAGVTAQTVAAKLSEAQERIIAAGPGWEPTDTGGQ